MFDFKLPDIGEGVTEGEIVEWFVNVGDSVNEDDPMVEVMTDKATVTIGAPRTGTIASLNCDVGAVAQVGEVIVQINTAGGAAATPAAAAAPAAAPAKPAKKDDGPAATAVGDIREGLPGTSFFSQKKSNGSNGHAASNGHAVNGHSAVAQDNYYEAKPLATPATRKLARDMEIDLRRVRPSGPSGRVTKDDVRAFAGAAPAGGGLQEVVSSPKAAPARAPMRIEAPTAADTALEERKPFVGIRRKIAERMQTAKNTAAHFTFVEEVDCEEIIALRNRLKPQAEAAGVKLNYLPFIVKAVVSALKKHPTLNTALDESTNELVYRKYFHIGIAAQTDTGLMVPVIRDADKMSILDIAKEIQRLGDGARDGSLSAGELSGSTFTITSLGKQGGLFATPVLNHPEVGILGVHQMKQKPVVKNGEIAVGNIMLLSLSFDHRIVDGHIGAAFAYSIIEYLENPDKLFLEMA